MSGGVLDAVERTSAEDLAKAVAGFRWLGLDSLAALLTSVRGDVDSGALVDEDQAEPLKLAADSSYHAILPSDETLVEAFRRGLDDDPAAFASE